MQVEVQNRHQDEGIEDIVIFQVDDGDKKEELKRTADDYS